MELELERGMSFHHFVTGGLANKKPTVSPSLIVDPTSHKLVVLPLSVLQARLFT